MEWFQIGFSKCDFHINLFMNSNNQVLKELAKNVYVKSVPKLEEALAVRGYDFNKGLDYEKVF